MSDLSASKAEKEDGSIALGCFFMIFIIAWFGGMYYDLAYLPEKEKRMRKEEDRNALSKDSLEFVKSGYSIQLLKNGELLACQTKNKIISKNALRVECYGERSAAIKLVDVKTGECLKYLYVNGYNDFTLGDISEGKYLLKIAKGKECMIKDCSIIFLRDPDYVEDTLWYWGFSKSDTQEIKLDFQTTPSLSTPWNKTLESKGSKNDFNQ